MARIQDLLDGELIIGDLAARDKAGVIREFASFFARSGRVGDAAELERVLLERESQCSTGIGDGVAIPHAKLKGLGGMVIAFGRSRSGVDFQSLDGKPAHLFFVLVTPDDRPGDHLRTLARISRILRNPVLRGELMRSGDLREIHKLILDEDGKYPAGR